MIFKPFTLSTLGAAGATGVFLAVVLTGCQREEISSYQVPKESPAPAAPVPPLAAAPSSHTPHATLPAAMPQVTWGKLPADWTETGAGQMSVASFNITGASGEKATVAITPLRGLAGKEGIIVNMWRQQVGQSELTAEEAVKQLSPVEIGDAAGKMFEVTGKAEAGPAMRIVTAMLNGGDTSWFFKLAGNDALVQAQKPAFTAFLKSIKISEAPASAVGIPAMGSAPAAGTAPAAASDWKIPAGWKSVAPGAMQVAKFSVPEKDGAKADVMVSVFPNATGTTLMNVNRWRGQVGLGPVTDAELAPLVKPLDEKIPDAEVADMTNNGRRLVGAIVPRGGQWFFFKLLGDEAAVAAQKEAFLAFAKSPQ